MREVRQRLQRQMGDVRFLCYVPALRMRIFAVFAPLRPDSAARHTTSTLTYCKVLSICPSSCDRLFIISLSFNSILCTARCLVNDELNGV